MKQNTPAEKRLGFRIHAIVFVLTLSLLTVINLLTGAPYWIVWVVPGWAIGLLAHWFFVLGPGAVKDDQDRDGDRIAGNWSDHHQGRGRP